MPNVKKSQKVISLSELGKKVKKVENLSELVENQLATYDLSTPFRTSIRYTT